MLGVLDVVLGLFILLIGSMLLVGWIPAVIARSKGRDFFPWWIYGGLLFIVALIHSICMCGKEEYLKRTAGEGDRFEKMTHKKNEAYKNLDARVRRML